MKTTTRILIVLFVSLNAFSAVAQLAKCKGKYFGNILQYSVPGTYNTYWNQVTSENGSKWGSVEGTKGVYNFGNSDLAYNWAKNNNGLFKYHCLMWGGQTPGWVSTASTATITAAVEPYFKAVRDHYAPMGGLTLMDVLNEPVNTPMPGNLKAALTAGYQAEPANAADKNNQYGWVIWCFQLARKYFPDATLLINEYNTEMNWGNCRTPYIAMVNAVKNAPNLTDGKKNLIDGVGLQCHGINNLTAANFKACIDEIWNKTGVAIHITEFDATADPNEAKQQSVYSTLIPVAWEHPHVAGITLWGYIQGSTWIGGNGVKGSGGTDSGILYSDGTPRPALNWLKSYMASQPSLPCCPAPGPFASCTNAVPTVAITSPADNAGYTVGDNIVINVTAIASSGSITDVKFYDGTTLLSTDNSAPYSYSWFNATVGSHTVKAVATDNQGKTGEASITIKVNVPQGSYNGNIHQIPGTIQVEEYDLGGNGFAYFDDSPGSETGVAFRSDEDVDIEACTDAGGGYNLGWATLGEWLEYTVDVKAAGTYDLDLRVACNGDGRTISVTMDGKAIASDIAIPNTTDWQTWTTTTVKNVTLKAGKQIMRITLGGADYINLNYVAFKAVNVSIPPTVSLTAPANNSSFTMLETVTLTATASDEDGTVASVQFYDDTTLIGTDNTAPYSFDWSGMQPGSHTLTAVATDDKGISTISAPISITITAVQAPYNGSAHLIPGRIEVEEYDLGGEGLGYHEADTNGNEGGANLRNDQVDIETTGDVDGNYNIAYIMQGEWLEYTVDVLTTDVYGLNLRVAADGDGKAFHIEMDGTDISGSIAVPNTGGWQTWQTVSLNNINLTEGEHVMRIAFDSDYMNLNYVEFTGVITGISNDQSMIVEMFPNPFIDNGIHIRQSGSFRYRITDLSGNLLESGFGNGEKTVGQNLITGVYFITVESNNKAFTKKIIRR